MITWKGMSTTWANDTSFSPGRLLISLWWPWDDWFTDLGSWVGCDG